MRFVLPRSRGLSGPRWLSLSGCERQLFFLCERRLEWPRLGSAGQERARKLLGAFVESFNGRSREELLNIEEFSPTSPRPASLSKPGGSSTTPTDPLIAWRADAGRVQATVDRPTPTCMLVAGGSTNGTLSRRASRPHGGRTLFADAGRGRHGGGRVHEWPNRLGSPRTPSST